MSDFKNALKDDVATVFLNIDEFAEYHRVDNQRIKCILDKTLIESHQNDSFLGVFANQITLYVSEGVLDVVPKEGQILSVDNSVHLVRKVSLEQGVIVIVLEEAQQ